MKKTREAIIALLGLLCISISYYFQTIGVNVIYTHIFYIPIILSCVWMQSKGILVALILGLSIIIMRIILGTVSFIIDDLSRILIFITVSILVAHLSKTEKLEKMLIISKNQEIVLNLRHLEEKNKDLEKSKKELVKNIKEIEKKRLETENFNKIVVGRELKMIELKKKIRELEGK